MSNVEKDNIEEWKKQWNALPKFKDEAGNEQVEVTLRLNSPAFRKLMTLNEDYKNNTDLVLDAALTMLWRDPFYFQAFWNEYIDNSCEKWIPVNTTGESKDEFNRQNAELFQKFGILPRFEAEEKPKFPFN